MVLDLSIEKFRIQDEVFFNFGYELLQVEKDSIDFDMLKPDNEVVIDRNALVI